MVEVAVLVNIAGYDTLFGCANCWHHHCNDGDGCFVYIPILIVDVRVSLSSCSLPISRIAAAAVEVIDYEYYGNMVSRGGVLRRLVAP